MRAVALAAAAAGTAVAAAPAGAVVTPTADPLALARAIADRPGLVAGAGFETAPTSAGAAVSTTRLGQFPTSGSSFAILTTGDPRNAAKPNTSPGTGTILGGEQHRGARDVTTLRVDVDVPENATCLSVRFRFYSEEFPEWTGDVYNDAFLMELDRSTWSANGASPGVSAPDNFAFDPQRRPITINSIGPTAVSPARATGTTYDAATPRLRASVPVTPGRHSVYLTILDQGDRIYDSAAFVDRLTVDRLNPCTPGAVLDVNPGLPAGAVELKSGRVSIPAQRLFGSAGRFVVRDLAYRPNPIRTPGRVRLAGTIRDTRGYVVRNARVKVLTLPGRFFRPVGEVRTRTNGRFAVTLRPTSRFRARGDEVWAYVRARKPGASIDDRSTGTRLIRLRVR